MSFVNTLHRDCHPSSLETCLADVLRDSLQQILSYSSFFRFTASGSQSVPASQNPAVNKAQWSGASLYLPKFNVEVAVSDVMTDGVSAVQTAPSRSRSEAFEEQLMGLQSTSSAMIFAFRKSCIQLTVRHRCRILWNFFGGELQRRTWGIVTCQFRFYIYFYCTRGHSLRL